MRFVANGSLPTAHDWLERKQPVRYDRGGTRLVAEPERVVLGHDQGRRVRSPDSRPLGVRLGDIQGKEAGIHKCEEPPRPIADYTAAHGRPSALWFVEDRLDTLNTSHHADLADVRCSWRLGATTTAGDARVGAERTADPPARTGIS